MTNFKITKVSIIIVFWALQNIESATVIGRKQIGDAGNLCSFMTTLLVGPGVGYDRNGGNLKTVRDIKSLYGPFSFHSKREYAKLVKNVSIENLRKTIYAPECVWSDFNNLSLIFLLHKENQLTNLDYEIIKKLLLESNFINLRSFCIFNEIFPENHAEMKNSFLEFWSRINMHSIRYPNLHDGNEHFFRTIFELKLMSKEQCRSSIKKVIQKYKFFTEDLFQDAIYFGMIESAQTEKIYERLRSDKTGKLILKLRKVNEDRFLELDLVKSEKTNSNHKQKSLISFGLDARIIASFNSGYSNPKVNIFSRCILGRLPFAITASRGYTLNEKMLLDACTAVNQFNYLTGSPLSLADVFNKHIVGNEFLSYCSQCIRINLNETSTLNNSNLKSSESLKVLQRVLFNNIEITLTSLLLPKRWHSEFRKNKKYVEFYSALYYRKSKGLSDEL